MISKLIKYDLKYIYKQTTVFYIIVLVLAIIARLTFTNTSSFLITVIHMVARGATLGFSVGMLINAMMRTWARFNSNFYGDESYLTHTLPISRNTLWTAKCLTGIIVIFMSMLVFALAIFISAWDPSTLEAWSSSFATRAGGFGNNFWLTMIVLFFAFFTQFIFMIQAGLSGLTLGHRRNSHPMLWSVIFGAIIYILGEAVLLISFFGLAQIIPSLNSLFYQNTITTASAFNSIMTMLGFAYIILTVITFFIGRFALRHGVNVD